jgi:hypothetical protein
MRQRSSWASYAIWGSIATCAVVAAAATITLVVGNHRGIQFASVLKRSAPTVEQTSDTPPSQPAIVAAPSMKDHEIGRLNDALRALSAERDRLEERLSKLEQSLGDITASINSRASEPVSAAAPAPPRIIEHVQPDPRAFPRVAAAPTQPVPPPEISRHGVPSAGAIEAPGGEVFLRYVTAKPLVAPPSATQEPMQIHATPVTRDVPAAPADSSATRTEFGIDLGGEPNINAIRARWINLQGGHGGIIGNLRPVVSVREGARAGSIELRLIAGPVANAGEAARLCASLQTKGVNCNTAVYDGQRLALR